MTNRQLFILFSCSLVPWTIGNGILPLLPVYAVRLGASPGAAGAYLAFSYLSLTAGTLAAGWLSDRFQSRKNLLIAAGVAAIPATWLTGRVGNLWELTIITAILWFLGGLGLALVSIIAGLLAHQEERGNVFGLLALTGPLGWLVGGLASGPLVDRLGFSGMFAAFAAFSITWVLAAALVKDTAAARVRGGRGPGASLAAMIAFFVSFLGWSLAMKGLGFSAAAISGTGAVAGAVTVPFTWLAGRLSDRLGRRWLLAACYLAGALGLGLLGRSVSIWHFWIAVSLMSAQSSVNRAVGSALVADLVPEAALGRGMAFFLATMWIGGVVGFAVTGFAIESIGVAPTFFGAVVLSLLSMALLLPIRCRSSRLVPTSPVV